MAVVLQYGTAGHRYSQSAAKCKCIVHFVIRSEQHLIIIIFLKTHGTAVSCYTGEEERKQSCLFVR